MPEKQDWDGLTSDSIVALRKAIKNGATDDELPMVRVAASALSSCVKHEQTEGARQATGFMIARELAKNSEELAEYMRITMPGGPEVKLLATQLSGAV